MKSLIIFLPAVFILFSSCQKMTIESETDDVHTDELYFPPFNSNQWAEISPESLGWNTLAINDLYSFLDQSSTRAFLLLKDGKIVIEYYQGKSFIGLPFTERGNWYWASAGKTLTSALVGIAQDEGHLDLMESSSKYLGEGWTSLDSESENKIKIIHHLSMTTGLDEQAENGNCQNPDCFIYKSDPGKRWSYHNAPYTILDQVIENSTGESFDDYFDSRIKSVIGMDGSWEYIGDNHVFFSTPRSMARFGLLILNKGKWEEKSVIPENYVNEMVHPSQSINNAYGYLWWLNGYEPIMVPGLQLKLNRLLAPSAPVDMIAAMGKNAQYLNIVPSEGLVMVRLGESPNNELVPLNFQEDLWQHINKVIN